MYIILGIILFIIVSFLISHFIVIYYIFTRFFKRFSDDYISKVNDKDPTYDKLRSEINSATERIKKLDIKEVSVTSFDNLKLAGKYIDKGNDKVVILFQGVHSNIFHTFSIIAERFLLEGYNVLFIHQRTHGPSEGKYITYGKKESKDVLSWIDFADKELNVKEIYLYGVSMGATSLCLASEHISNPKVKGLVIDSPFTSINALVSHLTSSKHIPSFLFLGGVKFLAKHLADVSFDDFDTAESIKSNKIPAFFVYGDADIVVTKDFLFDNYNNCSSIKEELIIKDAAHTLAMPVGGEEAFQKMFKFLKENK